ncbi:MAG TPA: NrfD/PsrC family molybdoenzyme membrane anchor subunit [Tepidisphaeraceae bacterium]|nr:NrfD/PsrC family molybdoenzyme membrane anchor subunit [Tepidisphaeraceae bacterium]
MADNEKDFPYQAGWVKNIQHKTDPNRVTSLQISSDPFTPQSPQSSPHALLSQNGEPSYYNVSILKSPVWKYEIASYFFLGGLSAGAYMLARVAERVGGDEHRDLTRAGTWVAMAAVIPCPILLIHDLGDRWRFHHMLRVFKPSSPMNVGTWTLVAYSGMLGAAFAREVVRDIAGWRPPGMKPTFPEERDDFVGTIFRSWRNVHDGIGIPFAIALAGYTGVLLSCTSNPMWCKNPWLGPLFSASAIGTGAAAISLTMDLTSSNEDSPSHKVLDRVDTVAHIAETVTMAGYLRHAGEKAKPLTHGSMKKHMKIAAGALIGAEVLKHLPLRGRAKKGARMAASILGLVSGFSLRWAMIYGAHEAANDPRLARLASKPKQSTAKNSSQTISEKPTRRSMGVNRAAEPDRVGGSAHNGGAHGIVPG